MAKNGPIIIVEDNREDQKLIDDALNQIAFKNRIQFCDSGEAVLEFLGQTTEKPFIILTKLQLPGMNGLELLERIHANEHLRKKGVPFIFFTDADHPNLVEEAYDRRVQGYFVRPQTFIGLKLTLLSLTDYWSRAIHPSNVKGKE